MATLTAQQITVSGITPSLATSAAGGDQFANDGTQVVWIQNNHASAARTFTFVTQATLGGLAVTDLTVTVTAANDNAFVGPFPKHIYNDSSGYVQVTYSDSAADCKIGVFNP